MYEDMMLVRQQYAATRATLRAEMTAAASELALVASARAARTALSIESARSHARQAFRQAFLKENDLIQVPVIKRVVRGEEVPVEPGTTTTVPAYKTNAEAAADGRARAEAQQRQQNANADKIKQELEAQRAQEEQERRRVASLPISDQALIASQRMYGRRNNTISSDRVGSAP